MLFLFGFRINGFIFPFSCFLYLAIIYIHEKKFSFVPFAIPFFFSFLVFLYSYTFDTTYDGQDYQQTGVMALSYGWNPLYEKSFDFHVPTGAGGEGGEFGKPYAQGYPKFIWEIEACLYRTFGYINGAKAIILVFALIGLAFLFELFNELGITRKASYFLLFLFALNSIFLKQIFSFMQDGLSYWLEIIFMCSLILYIKTKEEKFATSLVIATVFLLGSKFNNLPFVFIFFLPFMYFIYREKYIPRAVFVLPIYLLLIFLPNYFHFGSPVYPGNTDWAARGIVSTNIPLNIVGRNRLELLLYGIFSKAQTYGSNLSSPENSATLKWPFTFSRDELKVVDLDRVGQNGIFFSGTFLLSLIVLLKLYLKKNKDTQILHSGSLVMLGLVASSLLLPVPNALRLSPLVISIPLMVYVMGRTQGGALNKILIFTITLNSLIFMSSAINFHLDMQKKIRSELDSIKGERVEVYAANFYSSYVRLSEAGIDFVPVSEPSCSQPQVMVATDQTFLCPQKAEY